MATRLTDEFPARTKAPTSAYPDGSYMNETAPGANDGTPLDERIGDDYEGLKQGLLDKAGITPNGQPDSVTNPQQLQAIEKFIGDGDSQLAGGAIWPFSSQDSAANGQNVNNQAEILTVGASRYRLVKTDGSLIPANGVISSLNTVTAPFTVTIGSDDFYLANIDLFSKTVSNIEAFQADPSGVTNSTESIRAASIYANANNLKLKGAGDFLVDASDTPIDLQTDTDFSGATFTCSSVDPNVGFQRTYKIFVSTQSYTDITGSMTQANFTAGATKIFGTEDYEGFLAVNSTEVANWRFVNGTFSPVLKREPVRRIGNDGRISDELHFDFTSSAGFEVLHKPRLKRITVKFGEFDVSDPATNIYSPYVVTRNNVKVVNIDINNGDNSTALYTPFEALDCSDTEIDGIYNGTLGESGNDTDLGYLMLLTMHSNCVARDLQMRDGWSGINGNFFRGLTVRDSDVFAFSCHQYSADIKVYNSTFYREGQFQGYGSLELHQCKHLVNPNSSETVGRAVLLRGDYGGDWNGNIKIRDLEVVCGNPIISYVMVDGTIPANVDPTHIGSEFLHVPNVDIKGVDIFVKNTMTFFCYGFYSLATTTSNTLYRRVMPNYIKVNDCTVDTSTVGGLGSVFASVYNNWDMSQGSDYEPIIRWEKLHIQVGNIVNEWPTQYRNDPFNVNSYGVYLFPTPETVDLIQKVDINNADLQGIYPRTFKGVRVLCRNTTAPYWRALNLIAGDNRTAHTDSLIEYQQCRLTKMFPNITGLSMPTGHSDCIFDWTSYYGDPSTSSNPIFFSDWTSNAAWVSRCKVQQPRNAFETIADSNALTLINSTTGFTSNTIFGNYEGKV